MIFVVNSSIHLDPACEQLEPGVLFTEIVICILQYIFLHLLALILL